MLIPVLLFILGFVLLIVGGNWFVDGAVGIAHRFHLPELLIGATVVSIGTTLPEVMVSSQAALALASRRGPLSCSSMKGTARSGAPSYWGRPASRVRRRVKPRPVSKMAVARMAFIQTRALDLVFFCLGMAITPP